MMIKRVLTTILLLSACLVSQGKPKPRYVIGVSQCSSDQWREVMNDEMKREARFYRDVELEILSANDNSAKQIEDIRYFIGRNVDLLVIAPNEVQAVTPIVEEAFDRGIPVIIADREIDSEKYTAFIGASNYEVGFTAGQYIISKLTAPVQVIEICGLKSSSPANQRHQGFTDAVRGNPMIRLLASVSGDWTRPRAEILMDSLMGIYPKVDVVFAHNDPTASGAYIASRRSERDIRFVGVDALLSEGMGVDMVMDGILDATFIYPTGGDKIVQIAMNILEGRSFPHKTKLNTSIVDRTNARILKMQQEQISERDNKIQVLGDKIDSQLVRYSNQKMLIFAFVVILLLLTVLLLFSFKTLRIKSLLAAELQQRNDEITHQKEQLETQHDQLVLLSKHLEEVTQAKLVFFTNISHDFRTPLTLISDPVEMLLQEDGMDGERRRDLLRLIDRNVKILLRLINQILDFRKYENGKLGFSPENADLAALITEWNDAFRASTRKKMIRHTLYIVPGVDYRVGIDIEKMERIFFNLMSNALKFTPEGGEINITLGVAGQNPDERKIELKIRNTGKGISQEHIQNIFDRFYNINTQLSGGTGIGLAVVKAFVEVHNGTIQAESSAGMGTLFTIELPLRLVEERVQAAPAVRIPLPSHHLAEEVQSISVPEIDPRKECILVIEDNADIRGYICGLLSAHYQVVEAADGTEGIRKAMRYIPDIVVCDVMMPGIDGIECCGRLKSELQTCHIPVILLTACALDERRIEGFEQGADAYISKPFSSAVLMTRVRNLIDSRRKLKLHFGDNRDIKRETVNDADQNFINRVRAHIDTNLSDPDYNVETLAEALGMGRTQLYRKVKSLTTYSPNGLLRITRLKKAAAMLSSTTMTIAEIAYATGFSAPTYFSTCFKEQFGESPSDMIARRDKQ